MENPHIKIFVACHKPDEVYSDEVYTPIHVGRSISSYKEEMSNMIGDDTGDNISELNSQYCELTALYWAWKNLKDVDYVGLCHYRRFFEHKITIENVDRIMNDFDIILSHPDYRTQPLESKLAREVMAEDELIFMSTIRKLYPDYYQTAIEYLYRYKDIRFNMFFCRKDLMDKYCKWLFSILFECEKIMKEPPYTNSRRRMGYLGEFLLPIYCLHNKLRIKYDYTVNQFGGKREYTGSRMKSMIVSFLFGIFGKKKTHFEPQNAYAVIRGLQADGINIQL